MKKILIIVGTRPNFIKVTQFKKEVAKYNNLEVVIAHTGQHYDKNMSDVFFNQFNLRPDHFLGIQANSTAAQMGKIMVAIDEIADIVSPDIMIAVGDVNSTLCASIVANKRGILLGHLESGLRSRDRSMPEEINRLLTDEITDHFFVTEKSGLENLKEEGKKPNSVHFVGNTMIDTMVAFGKEIEESDILEKLEVEKEKYILFTMHRPSNVDNKEGLEKMISLLAKLCGDVTVVFPIHHRTINGLKKFGLLDQFNAIENLVTLEPQGYFAFQKLIAYSKIVITDSGGIQEETTFKQIPCITIRENTERPITIDIGTNKLMNFEVDKIISEVNSNTQKNGTIPELWDGKATERIVKVINGLV